MKKKSFKWSLFCEFPPDRWKCWHFQCLTLCSFICIFSHFKRLRHNQRIILFPCILNWKNLTLNIMFNYLSKFINSKFLSKDQSETCQGEWQVISSIDHQPLICHLGHVRSILSPSCQSVKRSILSPTKFDMTVC